MNKEAAVNKVMGRRALLKIIGAAGLSACAAGLGLSVAERATAATPALGTPQPEEKVQATLERLFGKRTIQSADDKIKLDAPLIAENGSVVPVRVDADLPMTADKHVKNIYLITDSNRRPLNAKFALSAESGRASVATNLRIASTSNVRAIAEMNDGTLYMTMKEVKVTIGGCGG